MTLPRPLTLSPTIFCYPSYPVLVAQLLLSPGFNHIFRIVATSLKLLTLTLLLASLPLVSFKASYSVPPSSLHSSTISLLSSPVTLQFCSLMIPPSTLSVTVFPPSSHLFSSAYIDLANLRLQRNGLRINAAKTKSMLIHSSRKDDNLSLRIDDRSVEHVRSFKFLGVVVNDTLTWADHIDMVCKKVSRSLNLLRRLSWFLPQPLLLLYLKSYILPYFDYCDVVWIGCTKAESLRLESLLNFACRTVLHRCKLSSASAARCELGLSTLSSRRKFHLAQTVFKCLYSPCPTYLSWLFPPPAPPTTPDLPLLN